MVEGAKWVGVGGVGRGLIDLIGGEESAIIARPTGRRLKNSVLQ